MVSTENKVIVMQAPRNGKRSICSMLDVHHLSVHTLNTRFWIQLMYYLAVNYVKNITAHLQFKCIRPQLT